MILTQSPVLFGSEADARFPFSSSLLHSFPVAPLSSASTSNLPY